MLKEQLLEIERNDYTIPFHMDKSQLLRDMVKDIGTTDEELREQIYHTFYQWTVNQTLTKEDMRQLVFIAVDEDHLFYQIDEPESDAVFTRTFSVLLVPLALQYHTAVSYLTESDVRIIKDKVITYISREKDLRGYVRVKGWAHGIAHAADALEDIAGSSFMNEADLEELLAVAHQSICINRYYYVDREDERMAEVISTIVKRSMLSETRLVEWFVQVGKVEKIGSYPEDLIMRGNIRNFLRSIYFKLAEILEPHTQPYGTAIKQALLAK